MAAWDLRRKNPKADGRLFWQAFKNALNKYPIIATRGWLLQDHALLAIEETNEVNHFLRQHANIPYNDPPTLAKIMQLALNIGQLLGSTTLPASYFKAKLYDIRTYLHEQDIIDLSNAIPEELELELRKFEV